MYISFVLECCSCWRILTSVKCSLPVITSVLLLEWM